MVVSSPGEFAAAVSSHRFAERELDREATARAFESVAESGLLIVGEPHGVLETPSVLYTLSSELGTRAVALEWSHEEMDAQLQEVVRGGSFDFEHLWSLPASAEFFCGDGRIAAGHFALLERLRDEGRLDQAIAFDRLDRWPKPEPDDWRVRDRELAERLLAEWDERVPLLVLTGAFHAQLKDGGGTPMAAHVARARTGLRPAMLDYSSGHAWSRGELHDVSAPMPEAPITFRLPRATPAVIPGQR